jgi:large subunit ribosomal protein L13
MEKNTHLIDVDNKIMGRIATRVAALLRGKKKPDFRPDIDAGDFVIIKNIEKLRFSGNKEKNKIYYSHSGYLGNLKKKPLGKFFKENPEKVFRKAVYGMLPKNKLRDVQIKRLKFQK